MGRNVKRRLLIVLLCATAAASAFAGGAAEVPEAEILTSGTQYISPNGDAVQETGVIDFKVTVYVKSKEGYIPEYGIRVLDDSGNVVREIVEREKSDIGWFLRLFRRYQAFTLEKSLAWDGTDGEGALVADGEYGVEMWIVASEKRTTLSLDGFVVDTTPPSVRVSLQEPKIFSPNGDGNLETYTIEQRDGTAEDEWRGRIVDGDSDTIRAYLWTGGPPETIVWDGTDDAGAPAPDGAHRYLITATDRAGNSFAYESDEFQLVTIETPISIALDREFISPNGDGVQDELTVALDEEVTEGILRWSVFVDDGEGTVVRAYGGDGAPPDEIVFDGLDDAGGRVRGGGYRVLYTLRYRNGNEPFVTDRFVLDVTKPRIDVSVSEHVISPNGDRRKDETRIWFKSSEIVTWRGAITDSTGRAAVSTDSTRTTSLIVWAGNDFAGNPVADGVYYLDAAFTDRAGNTTEIPTEVIVVDTTPPTVTFDLDKDYFSPDGDSIKDTLTATFTSSEPVRGMLTLTDSNGRDVGTLGGLGRAYQFIDGSFRYTWGGITGSGLYIPDGAYTVSSLYEDRAGNRVTLEDRFFVVDTRKVRVSISAPKGFSPNGDGQSDSLPVTVDAAFYDTVERWRLEFVDGFDKVLRSVEGAESLPREFLWDGSMQFAGPEVKTSEGLYRGRLSVTYLKGDSVVVETAPFFVDVTPPAVNLEATADPFARTDGAIEGDLYITLHIDDAHEVADWSMDVLTADGRIVRSFTGTGDLQDQIVWKDDREEVRNVPVTEQMTIRVRVVDEVGNVATFERRVAIDILVVNREGKLYLMVPNIIFGAYQHELDSRGAEQLQENLDSIGRVVEIYNKYPDYRLLLEGHALNVFRGDAEAAAKEEKILVPLTERRAETVKRALIERGLDPDMIETEWFGGTRPIVDVHDREIRWKNRRVEFIMLRPEE